MRPVVWFAAASMLTTILHELTHAVVAYALGVRSTLYNYSADIDLTPAQAESNAPAIIRVAGPSVCLLAGLLALYAFRRARGSTAELPLLFLVIFGIGTFFGNLLSTSFVGDFSAAAISLGLPMAVRQAIGLGGALAMAVLHFWAGRELARWAPAAGGRTSGMLTVVALPVVLGTALVILVNQPMAGTVVGARIAEASFWLFAVAGALAAPAHLRGTGKPVGLHWADGAVALSAILAVRLMVRGIPFVP